MVVLCLAMRRSPWLRFRVSGDPGFDVNLVCQVLDQEILHRARILYDAAAPAKISSGMALSRLDVPM